MTRQARISYEFVEYIPNELGEGRVYISIPFTTVAHRCLCGCGREVVTPLSPADWTLTFDGEAISLDPSIGNWSFTCRSHYWIRSNQVIWASRWSQREIEAGRSRDGLVRQRHFDGSAPGANVPSKGRWRRLKD